MHTKFWSENVTQDAISETEAQILDCILKKQDVGIWTGFIWLRVGIGGGLL